jgi:tetratricopeptide (TPR) repeat protein
LLGMLAMADGRLSDARLNFENVLTLAGSGRWDAEKTHIFRREALKGLAAMSEAREDWNGAHTRLITWLELEPKNGLARQRLGRVLFALAKPEQAFESMKQAVKDMPGLEPAGVSMGKLYSSKGDTKKAAEWFEYARKLEPENPLVHLAHAGWLMDQGQAATARKEIDEALRLEPGSKDAQRLSAVIAWYGRDLAGAEKLLEPLHRDAPSDSVSANLLALALIEQEDAAKQSRGLQLAEVNAIQFPRSADVTTTLGWALYRAGRVDEAEQKLRSAIAGGMTPDVAYFLARVLADKGKTDDARGLLERATSQRGAFAHRDDAGALLKTLTK